MTEQVLIGFEMGTGLAIEVPVRHLAVTGQTQESGKTTTLEALIHRSGRQAIAFVTKREENSFRSGNSLQPYFRERADWQFVSSILEATFREKMKFERSWIMKVCKGAHMLSDVHANVKRQLKTAKGINESVYTTLDEYLEVVIPEINSLPPVRTFDLERGVNIMDISKYSTQMQQLVIASVLEYVYQRERNVITVIPEAWEFVPEQRNSPCKLACISLIRKGAAAGNYVWLDSQDIAGVSKEVLRQVPVWVLGVQREINEVKRTLSHIPVANPKPKAEQIQTLGRGEFFVNFGKQMHRVYVAPYWLPREVAAAYAMGVKSWRDLAEYDPRNDDAEPYTSPDCETGKVRCGQPERDVMALADVAEIELKGAVVSSFAKSVDEGISEMAYKEMFEQEKLRADELAKQVQELQGSVRALTLRLNGELGTVAGFEAEGDVRKIPDVVVNGTRKPVVDGAVESPDELVHLSVTKIRPELTVTIKRREIQADEGSMRGRLAILLSEGFFDTVKTNSEVSKELKSRGLDGHNARITENVQALAKMGFLKLTGEGYLAVPGMKARVIEE